MRILIDESLPRRLGSLLIGHEVLTVARAGWSGEKNGELLRLAATRFDVFITADQNLQYQQNLASLPVAVLVLKAVRTISKLSSRWFHTCFLRSEALPHEPFSSLKIRKPGRTPPGPIVSSQLRGDDAGRPRASRQPRSRGQRPRRRCREA